MIVNAVASICAILVGVLLIDSYFQRLLWKENIAWMKEQERINREIAQWIHAHGEKP